MFVCNKHCVAKTDHLETIQIVPGDIISVGKSIRNKVRVLVANKGIGYLDSALIETHFKHHD
ncbi:hypothetical protein G7061_04160 [Erysipelothrix sp. HDW6B]|uniref:hypothetical protein n=1 Tax=Erysipelothrix sp. HDW6B TaxID=2714929 RepID=UPI00140BE08D|nr:hypothetical protein [Erysipelothrix sp. HDW6B]QIK85849.1 hypothetical protein G7061_04160 [Erysipelothrix sp. HDW6B]